MRATRRSVAKQAAEPKQLSSPPATPGPPSKGKKRKTIKSETEIGDDASTPSGPMTPNSPRKRARRSMVKKDEYNDELPHNLGDIPELNHADQETAKDSSDKKRKNSRKIIKNEASKDADLTKKVAGKSKASAKKGKNNSYGLTPGQTPYPNWPHPTREECEEIVRLLSSVHGKVTPPKTIPMPSLTVSGCGEVPSVLDALIRTRLSAATSGTNSSRAFAGLVAKFGTLKEGIGKGSVDWNKVRLAETKDVFEAIKSGGLADVKSKDIKKILQMVWEENQARRAALVSLSEVPGSAHEAPEERNAEVARAESNVLSLDHLHLLSNEDAFDVLTKYPGIGPKTASCVMLFCMQRPSFAVDTHVFRLCKWLGWVPPPGDPSGITPGGKGQFSGATRNSTYAHCEVRIPDDLKYPLHQLFIKHGKTCPRCRAITGESSEGWEKGCIIDHLVTRSGGRKDLGMAKSVQSSLRKRNGKRTAVEEIDTEEDCSSLSDLGSDDGYGVSSTNSER